MWHRVRIALRDRDHDTLAKLESELPSAKPPIPPPVKNALAAQFRMAQGDEAGAKRLLIGASKKRPLDPHEKLILGFLLLDDAPKARGLFNGAAKARLRDPRIPEGLGTTMVDMGEVDKGLDMLGRAVRDDPRAWSARFTLGMAHVAKEQAAEALEQFEAVCKLHPDFEPAWLGYAAQSIVVGRAAEASRVLGPVVGKLKGRDELLLAYVDLLVHAGDVAKGLAAMTPLANASRDPEFLFEYIELCLFGRFLEPAELTLKKAEQLDAKRPRLWVLKGRIHELSNPPDLDEALACYDRALALDKKDGHALNAKGLALLQKARAGDQAALGQAAKLLDVIARRKDKVGALGLANLALLKLTRGEKAEAAKLAKIVLRRSQCPPAARVQAQRILEETGAT